MATEFTVLLDDRPGTLARLGDILGKARVNIGAIHGVARDGHGFVQFLPDDPREAAAALDRAEMPYTRREVLIVRVLDEPGMLGDVALVMADAGINIESVYVTTGGHVVLGVNDVVGALQIAASMAVELEES